MLLCHYAPNVLIKLTTKGNTISLKWNKVSCSIIREKGRQLSFKIGAIFCYAILMYEDQSII